MLSDENNILDAEKAFVALSLFNIMRLDHHKILSLVVTLYKGPRTLQRFSQRFFQKIIVKIVAHI